jgi:hypothetical protein
MPGSVDPKDFEIPQDYCVMDMREMMSGMDPDLLKQARATAQANLSERLKKQFCGARLRSRRRAGCAARRSSSRIGRRQRDRARQLRVHVLVVDVVD